MIRAFTITNKDGVEYWNKVDIKLLPEELLLKVRIEQTKVIDNILRGEGTPSKVIIRDNNIIVEIDVKQLVKNTLYKKIREYIKRISDCIDFRIVSIGSYITINCRGEIITLRGNKGIKKIWEIYNAI